ncbi:hypothetical protein NXW00_28430 [Bacteroides thetaiotaomicron]|nr:hypothetical protein [Bacteroides thetaiotaomicron]
MMTIRSGRNIQRRCQLTALYLVQNAYTTGNPNGTFPRLTLGNQGHGGGQWISFTFWLRNGRYLRLKSAQLGYTFPKKWMSPVGIQNLRIYVEGSNLFTISGLPDGIDPESPGVNNGMPSSATHNHGRYSSDFLNPLKIYYENKIYKYHIVGSLFRAWFM